MGESKSYKVQKRIHQAFNLETSLSPVWKSTYYLKFLFDWCRRIPNQPSSCIAVQSAIIIASFISLLYSISCLFFQLCCVIADSEKTFYDIVQVSLTVSDQPFILFTWFYFLVNRAKIQAFFHDWRRMEEHQHANKCVDSDKIKRTCIIVYLLYYIYGICLICYTTAMSAQDDQINQEGDLMATYYLDEPLRKE